MLPPPDGTVDDLKSNPNYNLEPNHRREDTHISERWEPFLVVALEEGARTSPSLFKYLFVRKDDQFWNYSK